VFSWATTRTSRRSLGGTRSRGRATRPRISRSRSRSSSSASTVGTTCAGVVTNWHAGPRPSSASSHWCQAREPTSTDRWCRCVFPTARRPT
jgi:hypothetical protein